MENNLTIEQIQAVIDKGGCLISDEKEIHYGRLELTLDDAVQDGLYYLYYEFSNLIGNLFLKDKNFGEGLYTVDFYEWREATPEEIEKYVPVEYRPKNMITDTKDTFIGGMNNKMETHDVQFISPNSYKFSAIAPDLIRSDVQHEVFSKSDLISFGNYLLSKEREEMVTSKPERGVAECAIVIRQVSDADYENWKIK